MKTFFWRLLFIGFLSSATIFVPAFAQQGAPTGAIAPTEADETYLMTLTEIKNLPAADRSAYLALVRLILSKGPDSLNLSTGNTCGETQRQCEASVFGEHVCIPKHSSASTECAQRMKKNASYSETAWQAYYKRVQSHCGQQKITSALCSRLLDTRISVFMGRRSH